MKNTKKLGNEQIEDILGLSSLQEGILFHYLKNPKSKEYCEQLSLHVLGEIDRGIFQQTWQSIVQANEMLRTVFRWEKLERPVQIVLKKKDLSIIEYDFSNLPGQAQQNALEEIREKDRSRGIDLENEPFRIILCKLGSDRHEMILTNHHIIYDGWSNGILLKEFLQFYNAFSKGVEVQRTQKTPLKAFIRWCQKQSRDSQKAFWQKELEGFLTRTVLEGDFPQQPEPGKMGKLARTLDQALIESLKEFANEERVTLASVFYTAWGILLQRYTCTDDVLFGTPVSGRIADIPGIEEMVGLLINTLPLRVKTNSDQTVSALVKQIDLTLRKRAEFEHTPLVEIKAYSQLEQQENLFDSLVVIENYPLDKKVNKDSNNLKIVSHSLAEMTNFDLTVEVMIDEPMDLSMIYKQNLFLEKTIDRMLAHYQTLLFEISRKPEAQVCTIRILSTEERERLVNQFNATQAEYPCERTIVQLFEEQVEKTPDSIAVICNGTELTYRQLDQKANQLARMLRDQGIAANHIIGLMLHPSLEVIIGMMGILKSGGAYVPIDPDYPQERIEYMLEDSQAKALLLDKALPEGTAYRGVTLNLTHAGFFSGNDSPLTMIHTPEDLAYIIYTSGSTGWPKGCMIPHKGLVNYIWWAKKIYLKGEPLDFPLYSSISFDLTVTSIYTPLISGNKIWIYTKDENELLIRKIVQDGKAGVLKATPAHLELIKDQDHSQSGIRCLIVGGEDFKTSLAREIHQRFAQNVEIYNEYGPTETVVGCTFHRFDQEQDRSTSVPIGVPGDNVQIFLLDQHLNLVPEGRVGEIYISGDGVGRGYLNKAELTGERFIPNPFIPGKMMYKTGDLGRWLPDGNLDFLGRMDQQVKIRGYRIELKEIESQLLHYQPVKEVVVIDQEDQTGDRLIAAYFVSDVEISPVELKEYLEQRLPAYMVPTSFIQLDTLPLTTHGKIDRKQLPRTQGRAMRTELVAANTEIEAKLLQIWKDLLQVDQIGIQDDFFELGGHSLKATYLVAKMHKEFHVKVPMDILFERPTVQRLAQYLKDAEQETFYAMEPVEEREYYPLSSAQKRMFILNRLEDIGLSYNTVATLVVKGLVDQAKLERIFHQLIDRHEILRTSFQLVDGEPVQKIHQKVLFQIDAITEKGENLDQTITKYLRKFDLSKPPLLRVGMIRLDQEEQIMVIDLHHIISDQISVQLLIHDFIAFYEGEQLPVLKLQYKDYAVWQNVFLKSERMQKQKQYWLERLIHLPELALSTDFPRTEKQSYEGEVIQFDLHPDLIAKLKELTSRSGTTQYMTLLAVYAVLLYKYTLQEDITIGSSVAGRRHHDVEQIMGVFINMIALRNYPKGEQRFADFLQEVKKTTIQAFEHQDYPFEELVNDLRIQKKQNRNPLYSTLFSLQESEEIHLETQDARFEPYCYERKVAHLDILLVLFRKEKQISCHLRYCTQLFKRETMEQFARDYQKIAQIVVAEPEIRLSDIKLRSNDERSQVRLEPQTEPSRIREMYDVDFDF